MKRRCPAFKGYLTCRDPSCLASHLPPPTPPPSPRQVRDPNLNGWLLLQRNKLKLSPARETRGKSCLGYPLPHKWALDEIFVCLCSLDNLSLILTDATCTETQVKWNPHLPRSECMFSHLLCTDGYTHMCRILQCLYMKQNGGSRVHRWRTRQLLGVIRNTAKLVINKERSLSRPSCSHMAIVLYLRNRKHEPCFYRVLCNNPSYSCILFGSRLWSIGGQTHDWRHHHKVFPSAVLKWRKVLRIKIIFYVTGQKIRYKKVLPRHWTGSRSQKSKDKAVSFRKWYRNNFLAASVGSRARLNHAQTWSS